MFSKKRYQQIAVADGLSQIGKTTGQAVQAAAELGASGAKLAEKVRAAASARLQNVQLPDQIQLPDLTLPRLQLGDIRREDVQLPDIAIPRFNAGNVDVKDVQLPDITVPRFKLGKVKPFGLGAGGGLRRPIRLAILGLVGLAVAKEMSQPEEQRQWHGRVLSVPYDFRPPTSQRFGDAFWNEHAGLVTPTLWGLGWAINFHGLMKLARAKAPSGLSTHTGSEVSRTSEQVRS